jgi:hypothetical protein
MARLFCFNMPEPKDFRVGCEFYTTVAIKAADELRKALPMALVRRLRAEIQQYGKLN